MSRAQRQGLEEREARLARLADERRDRADQLAELRRQQQLLIRCVNGNEHSPAVVTISVGGLIALDYCDWCALTIVEDWLEKGPDGTITFTKPVTRKDPEGG